MTNPNPRILAITGNKTIDNVPGTFILHDRGGVWIPNTRIAEGFNNDTIDQYKLSAPIIPTDSSPYQTIEYTVVRK